MAELVGAPRPRRASTTLAPKGRAVADLRPPWRRGVSIGALVVVSVSVLAAILAYRVAQQPVSLTSFVAGLGAALLLGGAAALAYWTFACFSLRYVVSDGNLTIRWGAARHVIPLGRVLRLASGAEGAGVGPVQGVHWPGHCVGRARVNGLGAAHFYATRTAPQDLVYVVTPEVSFALTADRRELQAALDAAPAGRVEAGEITTRHWRVLEMSFWGDHWALAVTALALLVNLALFGYVASSYPSLPDVLPLHFTPSGTVDRIGYRSEVFRLPAMALVVWAGNSFLSVVLHSRERLAAHVCLAGALLVQGLFLVALVKIVI